MRGCIAVAITTRGVTPCCASPPSLSLSLTPLLVLCLLRFHAALQADERGQPCYVEVTNAADVPLFESFGFAARPGEITPLFGVKFTVMTRSPRS